MSLNLDTSMGFGDDAGMNLPITPRGMFSQDPFFSSFKGTYDSAISDVLNRFSDKSSMADRLASYRRQRSSEPTADTLNATISQADDKYTQAHNQRQAPTRKITIGERESNSVIVLDMNEFINGEMTCKTVDRAALVEAKHGSKSYKRSFPLPNDTNWDAVHAELSDDGIMTITAPKKSGSRKSSVVGIQPGEVVEEAVQAQQVQGQESSPRKQSRSIPMFVEGVDGTSAEEMLSAHMGALGAPFLPSRGASSISAASSYLNRNLPISRRGKFFQDSRFESLWKDFEGALDEHLEKKPKSTSDEDSKSNSGDKTDSYRNLRKCVVQDDNQAATITSGEEGYRIVVDVSEFCDGNLSVKGVEGAVIVKGSKGNLSFKRSFTLPGLSQPEEVHASLSADGVLTITAPK